MAARCWNLLVVVDADDSCISYLCGLVDVGEPFFVGRGKVSIIPYAPKRTGSKFEYTEYEILPYWYVRDSKAIHEGHSVQT